jgi:hypothetical protein
MKRPIPTPPVDAPPGTMQLGGPIGWFSASLHVAEQDLLPNEVTRLIGSEPTEAESRGVPLLRDDGSIRRVPKSGRWSRVIKSQSTDEWDISEVIRLLFHGLATDVSTWREIRKLGKIQVSLGLSLETSNKDFFLDEHLIAFLGERRISIWLDVYRDEA